MCEAENYSSSIPQWATFEDLVHAERNKPFDFLGYHGMDFFSPSVFLSIEGLRGEEQEQDQGHLTDEEIYNATEEISVKQEPGDETLLAAVLSSMAQWKWMQWTKKNNPHARSRLMSFIRFQLECNSPGYKFSLLIFNLYSLISTSFCLHFHSIPQF